MAILELVTFKLAKGISDEAFLAENEHLNNWVKSQPGFEYRALAKTNVGSWTDTVFWQTWKQPLPPSKALVKNLVYKV